MPADAAHTDPAHLGRAHLDPAHLDPGMSTEEFNATVSALTSAFGDPTRREIYLYVRGRTPADGGATAAEVADHFDIHPNVARHHLEKLTGGGYLAVESPPPPVGAARGAGRPSKRYRGTAGPTGSALAPRRDDILALLLGEALERLGPEASAALADEVGYRYGRDLASRMGSADSHRSVRSAVAAIADALTAHGFAARTEDHDGSSAIVSEYCPFGEAASEYPHVLCAVDRAMIRGMMEALHGERRLRVSERRVDGDDHCVTWV